MREPAPTVMRVLFVEDNPDLARALVRQLSASVDISWRMSIAEAATLLRTAYFDVVLLDLNLPDSSGLASLKRIQDVTEAPVVVLTGAYTEPSDESALRAVHCGAADWLNKADAPPHVILRTLRLADSRFKRAAVRAAMAAHG